MQMKVVIQDFSQSSENTEKSINSPKYMGLCNNLYLIIVQHKLIARGLIQICLIILLWREIISLR